MDNLELSGPYYFDTNNLSPEMQADLNAYYDWLEDMSGEQELPEDFDLR